MADELVDLILPLERLQKFYKAWVLFPEIFHDQVKKFLRFAGTTIENKAKETKLFQDRTTNLRRSISSRVEGTDPNTMAAIVWPGMEYGIYVHEGSLPGKTGPGSNRKPRPFLTEALDAEGEGLVAMFNELVDSLFQEFFGD